MLCARSNLRANVFFRGVWTPVWGGFGGGLGTGGGCPGGALVRPWIVLTFTPLLLAKNGESFGNTKWQKGPPGLCQSTSVCARACVYTDIIPSPNISQDFFKEKVRTGPDKSHDTISLWADMYVSTFLSGTCMCFLFGLYRIDF